MSVYMDYQNRVGHKLGSGAPATWQEVNLERKERLRRLALETIDLNKDPYFMRNHLGQFECRLCLTLHTNEGSYLSHTQGKKHQTNLSRRLAKEKADAVVAPMPLKTSSSTGRTGDRVRIGRPGYRVTKLRDERTRQFALLCEVEYPEIVKGTKPYHRFMSAFEQRVETPPDGNYQFLLFAAEPYETIEASATAVASIATEAYDFLACRREVVIADIRSFYICYTPEKRLALALGK